MLSSNTLNETSSPEALTNACPACGEAEMAIFHEAKGVPANSCILLSSPEEARAYPTGDIRLGFCNACGFIYNTAFDLKKTEYSGRYEETQAFSETFNAFHIALADRLIARHGLQDKDVLEIGCGKGEFLVLLAERGGNRGVGIDPGIDPARIDPSMSGQLTFIADFYSETYGHHPVDFLACKMTLEHIPHAQEFVTTVRKGLGDQFGSIVFFQVPEARRIVGECAFEDIYYEHCAYFSPGSLGRLFRRTGFDVCDIAIEYGDQYLTIEARPRPSSAAMAPVLEIEDDLGLLREDVARFAARFQSKLDHWRAVLASARQKRETVVLWGSGSKAVSFLTTVDTEGVVAHVTDINPRRHDHYMPLTAQRIVPPAELPRLKPDLVICMNRVYEPEIRAALSGLGLSPAIMSL